MSDRTSRAIEALKDFSQEEREAIRITPRVYSKDTIRKDNWVKKMYETYCETFHLVPWPLDLHLAEFVEFLGMKVKYAVSSIQKVIVPGLKRLNERIGHGNLFDHFLLFIFNYFLQ
jgi:hypothetical protein